MTTKRMSEEMWRRLTSWLRENCHAKISVGRQEGCQCGTCQAADMIDALRAELTAARTVGLENYNRACRERDEARRLLATEGNDSTHRELSRLLRERDEALAALAAIARNADDATDLSLFRVQCRDFAKSALTPTQESETP